VTVRPAAVYRAAPFVEIAQGCRTGMHPCMDWHGTAFDWNPARAFLVTAEQGSLSAAARALGTAQPMVGRRVRAIEASLGVALFERAGHGLVLTPTGGELVVQLRRMAEVARSASLIASGRSEVVEGEVTVTTTELAAAYGLPPLLVEYRAAHPEIVVEVLVANAISDLRRREAAIALQEARPTDPELIAKRLGQGRANLYAANAYLDAVGGPATPQAFAMLDFVGFADTGGFLRGLHAWDLPATDTQSRARTANHLVQWQMARAGLGVGIAPTRWASPTRRCAVSGLGCRPSRSSYGWSRIGSCGPRRACASCSTSLPQGCRRCFSRRPNASARASPDPGPDAAPSIAVAEPRWEHARSAAGTKRGEPDASRGVVRTV
jgi:DNA-binding transcriptional LysR family regulator